MTLITCLVCVPAVFLALGCVAYLVAFAVVSRRDSLSLPVADSARARHARRAAGVYVLRRDAAEELRASMPAEPSGTGRSRAA